jgi:hypothetical protein
MTESCKTDAKPDTRVLYRDRRLQTIHVARAGHIREELATIGQLLCDSSVDYGHPML